MAEHARVASTMTFAKTGNVKTGGGWNADALGALG